MEVSAALVPPPAPIIDTAGPEGEQVAANLRSMLGTHTGASAPGSVRPSLILVEPGEHGLVDLAERLAAATDKRGHRVWVVVFDPSQVLAADVLIDASDGVDALLLIGDSHPASAAAALAGWTWLRHDAPSLALGTLRDSTGRVCRIATLTATTPAEPPFVGAPGTTPTPDRAQSAWRAAISKAEAVGEQTAAAVLTDANVTIADAVAMLTGESRAAGAQLAQTFLAEIGQWHPVELTHLLPDEPVSADRPTGSATAAAMTLVEARAAMGQEESRAGFVSKIGRRKRLAELQQACDVAQTQWEAAAIDLTVTTATRAFTEGVQQALPAAITVAHERITSLAIARSRGAIDQWVLRTTDAAARLTPPPAQREIPIARSWGDAQPQVRRHLLIPADVQVEQLATESSQVTVHPAHGLPKPLAVAWVLGLSASAFGAETGSGASFEHSQSGGETQD